MQLKHHDQEIWGWVRLQCHLWQVYSQLFVWSLAMCLCLHMRCPRNSTGVSSLYISPSKIVICPFPLGGINPPKNICSAAAITVPALGVWDDSSTVVLTDDHWILHHLRPGGQHAHRPLQCLATPPRPAGAVSSASETMRSSKPKVAGCGTKGVSINGRTPKWRAHKGKCQQNGWSGGTPSLGNHQMMNGWSVEREVAPKPPADVYNCGWFGSILKSQNTWRSGFYWYILLQFSRISQTIFSFRGSNSSGSLNEFQHGSN